jgi:hypothetical protein
MLGRGRTQILLELLLGGKRLETSRTAQGRNSRA